ncbi:hypothetical protein ACJJTC_009380 [Scirpophaga incertulas]
MGWCDGDVYVYVYVYVYMYGRSASKQEIVKAYRKAAQRWHPDNFSGDDSAKKLAEKKFIDIAAAKELVSLPHLASPRVSPTPGLTSSLPHTWPHLVSPPNLASPSVSPKPGLTSSLPHTWPHLVSPPHLASPRLSPTPDLTSSLPHLSSPRLSHLASPCLQVWKRDKPLFHTWLQLVSHPHLASPCFSPTPGVLTDPEKRAQFDAGVDPLEPEARGGHGAPFHSPFHHFQHGSPFQFKFHFN